MAINLGNTRINGAATPVEVGYDEAGLQLATRVLSSDRFTYSPAVMMAVWEEYIKPGFSGMSLKASSAPERHEAPLHHILPASAGPGAVH